MQDILMQKIVENQVSNIETAKLCTLNSVQGIKVSVTPQGAKNGRPYPLIEGIRTFEGTDYSSKVGSTVLVVFIDKDLSTGVLIGVIT